MSIESPSSEKNLLQENRENMEEYRGVLTWRENKYNEAFNEGEGTIRRVLDTHDGIVLDYANDLIEKSGLGGKKK